MHDLDLTFLPEATRRNFNRLKGDARLSGFTLVGGTALSLQIRHRVSEDLDFNIFGQKLPTRSIDSVLEQLAAEGAKITSLITAEQKVQFKINRAENLDDFLQDYLIDGAKVTFHSRSEIDRPKRQIDFLKDAQKLPVSAGGFDVLGIQGLFVMKSIVVYDRVKSRDLFDLMILTRDHGYALHDVLAAIDAYQPIRHKDVEYFKSVVTGLIPLDKNDEGFSSIQLNIRLDAIYKHFKKLINDYEVASVRRMQSQAHLPRA